MIVTTIDPATGNEVTDRENHPFVVERNGMIKLKIYFESENSRYAHLTAYPDHADHYEDEYSHYS